MAKRIILRVDRLLSEKELSTADLAERAGIAYNTALSLRRGYPTKIDFVTLARICEVLNVLPGDVLDLVDESD
jgi:putative transcriptional regulator